MPGIVNNVMVESVAEALETMAFITAMAPEESMPTPTDAILVRMRFYGPVTGVAELVAGREFVEMLAANVLGIEPDEPDATALGTDAFMEMLNTTCGVLLPMLARNPEDIFDVTVPESEEIGGVEGWEGFVSQSDVSVLDADGYALAVRICH